MRRPGGWSQIDRVMPVARVERTRGFGLAWGALSVDLDRRNIGRSRSTLVTPYCGTTDEPDTLGPREFRVNKGSAQLMARVHAEDHREPSETESKNFGRLTREQVVSRIMNLNPTAGADFLQRFERGPLSDYLDRLSAAKSPRGSAWIRRGSEPAIVTRRPGG